MSHALRGVVSLFGLALALSAGAGCGAAPAASREDASVRAVRPAGPGAVFLIGGEDSTALLARFLERAGGPGARLVLVPFAGGSPSGARYAQSFGALGALAPTVLTGAASARAAETAAVRGADALFFVGGSPERLLEALPPFEAAVRDAWQRGCTLGGNSAGAMVWGDRVFAPTLRPGVGLLGGLLVDPHFSERARFARLWLACGAERRTGLGIDEGTAGCLEPDGELSCYGLGHLTVIRPEGGAGQPARVTLLSAGERLALRRDWLPLP